MTKRLLRPRSTATGSQAPTLFGGIPSSIVPPGTKPGRNPPRRRHGPACPAPSCRPSHGRRPAPADGAAAEALSRAWHGIGERVENDKDRPPLQAGAFRPRPSACSCHRRGRLLRQSTTVMTSAIMPATARSTKAAIGILPRTCRRSSAPRTPPRAPSSSMPPSAAPHATGGRDRMAAGHALLHPLASRRARATNLSGGRASARALISPQAASSSGAGRRAPDRTVYAVTMTTFGKNLAA